MDRVFNLDKFLLRPKLFTSNYVVMDEAENKLFYCKLRLMALGEVFDVREYDGHKQSILTVKNSKLSYLLESNENLIGSIKLSDIGFLPYHLKYNILDSSGVIIGTVNQTSKSDFDIYFKEQRVGIFHRRWNREKVNIMDISNDTEKRFDRKIALGLAVALSLISYPEGTAHIWR